MKSILFLSFFLVLFSCGDENTTNNYQQPKGGFEQQVIRTELTNDLWCTDVEIDICDQNENCQIEIEILQLDLNDIGDFSLTFIDYPETRQEGTWLLNDENIMTLTTEDGTTQGRLRMNSLSQFDLLDIEDPSVGLRFYECNDIVVSDDTRPESLEYRDFLLPLECLE